MARLTRFVLAHTRLVVAFWVLITMAGGATAGLTTSRLTIEFSLPGGEGFHAIQVLDGVYGTGGNAPALVSVVTLPQGTSVDSPGIKDQLKAAFDTMQQAHPAARIVSYASTGDRALVSKDGRTTYGLIFTRYAGADTPPENDVIKHAVAHTTVGGAPVLFTGYYDLQNASGSNKKFWTMTK